MKSRLGLVMNNRRESEGQEGKVGLAWLGIIGEKVKARKERLDWLCKECRDRK